MVRADRVGQGLKQHRFPGSGRRNDQAALALADRGENVHHARCQVVLVGFEPDPFVRIERRKVVVEDPVTRFFGRLKVYGIHLYQSQISLPFVRHADLAGYDVAGPQIELSDLRRRDVDVVRAWKIAVVRGPEKAVAFREDLQDSFGEDQPVLLGLSLQDCENEILLAHLADVRDLVFLAELGQLLDVQSLQFAYVKLLPFLLQSLLDGDLFFFCEAVLPRILVGHIAPESRDFCWNDLNC